MEHLGTYDVIVVGSRIAGSAAAIHMAKAGLQVLLVEQSQHLKPLISTHLIHPYGVDALFALDLRKQLEETQQKIPYININFGSNLLRARVTTVGQANFMLCPDRYWLDNILLTTAKTYSSIRVALGLKVSSLLRSGERVIGITGRLDGMLVQATAKLVVGADGRQSTIARLAQSKVFHQQRMIRSGYYGYFENFDWQEGPSAEFYVDKNQFYAFPMAQSMTCIVAGMYETAQVSNEDDLDKHLLRCLGNSPFAERVVKARLVGKARAIKSTQHYTFIRQCAGEGWALIGDAAMHTDPMLGQGIGLALRTAESLANIAISGFHQMGDASNFLKLYSNWRNHSLWDLYYIANGLSKSLDWGTQPWDRLLQKRISESPETASFVYSMMNQLIRPIAYFVKIAPALLLGKSVEIDTSELPKLPFAAFASQKKAESMHLDDNHTVVNIQSMMPTEV